MALKLLHGLCIGKAWIPEVLDEIGVYTAHQEKSAIMRTRDAMEILVELTGYIRIENSL
eukprot:gene7065-5088_t